MPKRIMILEDDEAVAELIRFYIKEEGFQAVTALTGKDFLTRVVEYQPDLITIDILLPDTNGFDVFKRLKEDQRTRDIPVIFVTVEEGEKENLIKMGANGYIVKPFKEHDLKETVKSILGKEQ